MEKQENKERKEIVIIGGGAAGMTAGIVCARKGCKVLLLEQKMKCGKKLLATGNGKCNFTNRRQDICCYRGENPDFIAAALSHFGLQETLEFFQTLGIYPKEKRGYFYPASEQSQAVVQVMEEELSRLGVEIQCGRTVTNITAGLRGFLIETEESKDSQKQKQNQSKTREENRKTKPERICYEAASCILAAGGCASPVLGSDGSGFILAKKLGHSLIPPLPALVSLCSEKKMVQKAAGVRVEGRAFLYTDGKLLQEETGELLFTRYGISGIPIMQLSRFAAKERYQKKAVTIFLDFFPDCTKQQVKTILEGRLKDCGYKQMSQFFTGMLNDKLAEAILAEMDISRKRKASDLSKKQIDQIAESLKRYEIPISKVNSFENAQATAGGIDTKEVNASTMESKRQKGLYLAGEILDVDGTCGGYNLQWAWTSGALAGQAAADYCKKKTSTLPKAQKRRNRNQKEAGSRIE